ncbi:hypothetical protein HG535_0C00630 [Zygotorulaspora mrakii]|uniref:Uncharacterized protein n=1 Tax=Zygotorulaspora mrakii TaxID=42260 RepID=A0A7H9B050_ZYGMR|nr:uncharacterized protein HG535_0C00630 [Zygotorulaspora mrakii]QLG71714.1 hypothetical protein HG535_0C00630 [Zygotorulaspora mrakii]
MDEHEVDVYEQYYSESNGLSETARQEEEDQIEQQQAYYLRSLPLEQLPTLKPLATVPSVEKHSRDQDENQVNKRRC